MTEKHCPGCGVPYNGKKCRMCGFQPLEKNIEQTPVTRRKSAVLPRKKSAVSALLGFVVILALIALLLPVLRNWGESLEEMEASHGISQPLPEYGDLPDAD